MSGNKFMNVTEIAEELGASKITVEFWFKRFNKWLPHIIEKNEKLYSMKTFNNLLFIAERINAGMLPSEIEKSLKEKFPENSDNNLKNSGAGSAENLKKGLSEMDTVHLLQSLVTSIGSNQERIAKAHERRAEAEERKAIAIEKRAEAEEKKAIAMNNIANALQNMKHEVWSGNNENLIKGEAAGAILLDGSSMDELSIDDSHEEKQSGIDILDDLSLLIDDKKDQTKDKNGNIPDDLSLLIENDESTEKIINNVTDKDIIETATAESTKTEAVESKESLDNLSLLLDENEKPEQDETDKNIDDLSMLIDDKPDDLSMLIDDKPDDLSLLIDEKEKNNQNNMDDLSMLIENEKEQVQPQSDLKPSVTLEENFNQYKSEIINSIIELKKDGLSVEQTTKRLNEAGVKTLSGKNRWGIKTIAKIYKFIESVN